MSKVLPLLLLAACQDYSLEEIKEEKSGSNALEVAPNPLVFSALPAGEVDAKPFTITNVGDVTLTINNVAIDEGTAFEIIETDENATAGRLGPSETMDVVVTWTSSGGDDIGTAVVMSEDVEGEVYVDLVGGAVVPQLTIDPEEVDYGAVGVGSSRDASITLSNTGQATLVIDAISETESVFTDDAQNQLPIELEPGEEHVVTVTFAPDSSDIWSGRMEVESNDPDGMKFATLNGEAGSQPIAECSVDPSTVMAIWEDATWVGDSSYDPQGYTIVAWDWTLVSAPSGSSATMPGNDSQANRSRFTPDLVGEYVAELVVTNEIGDRSEPCSTTLTAEAGGDMWIEMFWTHSGDDMDLHLLKPGGRFEDYSTDCYYANCVGSGLDWGVRGDADDDPALDLDDIPGTGPENINIMDPESGTFTVIVHDYPGSVYNGNNDVTINIYIGGALEWTDTRNLNSGEDDYEEFCEIDMPSGTVTSL
ncbi:MAG: choice-of-anchor D domain-containing protein [Myxococcota bacterium]